MHNECLYITGRAKDILFVNGQNYYPHDIERSIEVIDDVEPGKVVVSGCTDEKSGQEEILVFVLYKGKSEKFCELAHKLRKQINNVFGFEPGKVIPVREIPKTTSGKIQRFKLVEDYKNGVFDDIIRNLDELLLGTKIQNEIVDPVNNTEKKLREIWAKILSHKSFGTTDNFFEIGGNSLKAAEIISMIHKEFDVELNYNIFFEKQTILQLAKEIEHNEITQYRKITKIKEKDTYLLSSAQKRLYYIWEVDKLSIAYNIPIAFQIKGRLNIKQIEKAINIIIERHEVLRTSFMIDNGEPKQIINDAINYPLNLSKIDTHNYKAELKKKVQPFNLNCSPLFRVELMELSQDDHILFLDFHHIISDGVSISLFLDELFKIYHRESLPEIEIEYKDYVYWEKENVVSFKIKEQEQYWISQFEEDVPVLGFPTDYARPSIIDYHGEKLEFAINEKLASKLKELAKQENTSLFVLLLTVYNILISKHTSQEDIVVGIPISGRNHLQLQPMFGMFVNNLAIRSFPKGDITFQEFLSETKENILKGFNNQDYPFGELVEQIGSKRDISRNPLFDTMFIYQNMDLPQLKDGKLSVERCFFYIPVFLNMTFLLKYSNKLIILVTISNIQLHYLQ